MNLKQNENKKSEDSLISLILQKKVCAICEKNGLAKSYNLYLSGNRTLKAHAICISEKKGLSEAVDFLEKKLEGKFYFNTLKKLETIPKTQEGDCP